MNKTTTPEVIILPSAVSEETKKAEQQETETPGPHVIRNILSFSKSLEIKDSGMVGKITTVSN